MVATPVIHVTAWITTHLPTQEGWKAELAFVTASDSWLQKRGFEFEDAEYSALGKPLRTHVSVTKQYNVIIVCKLKPVIEVSNKIISISTLLMIYKM